MKRGYTFEVMRTGTEIQEIYFGVNYSFEKKIIQKMTSQTPCIKFNESY